MKIQARKSDTLPLVILWILGVGCKLCVGEHAKMTMTIGDDV